MKKRILILGGTGAMGRALIPILKKDCEVTVTSRKAHQDDHISYIIGNAHDPLFIKDLLHSEKKFDVVIDFMNYKVDEFQEVAKNILPLTGQYIFISSARVYAPSNDLLTENSPRLLDVCLDKKYLETQEYALAKAKEENILFNFPSLNWTIIRPGLTYNYNRMQFALWEKEEWLYRALKGKKILFPKEMAHVLTTMTYAEDVAYSIARLVGHSDALGEAFHIAGAPPVTWQSVFNIYHDAILRKADIAIKLYSDCSAEDIAVRFNRYYQFKYARGITRIFDNSKLFRFIGDYKFKTVEEGLNKCIDAFIDNGDEFKEISWLKEASFDRITGDVALWCEFSGLKPKVGYYFARYSGFINKYLYSK